MRLMYSSSLSLPGPKAVEAYGQRFEVKTVSGKLLFSADNNEVVVGAERLRVLGKEMFSLVWCYCVHLRVRVEWCLEKRFRPSTWILLSHWIPHLEHDPWWKFLRSGSFCGTSASTELKGWGARKHNMAHPVLTTGSLLRSSQDLYVCESDYGAWM